MSETFRGKIIDARVRQGSVVATLQLNTGEIRTLVEVAQPYGLTAVPEAGADVTVLQIGSIDHLVALLADDQGLRLSLAPGEIGLQDKRGQKVTLTPNGVRIDSALKVTIVTAAEVEITAPTIKLNGDVEIDGTLTANGTPIDDRHKHSETGSITGTPHL